MFGFEWAEIGGGRVEEFGALDHFYQSDSVVLFSQLTKFFLEFVPKRWNSQHPYGSYLTPFETLGGKRVIKFRIRCGRRPL